MTADTPRAWPAEHAQGHPHDHGHGHPHDHDHDHAGPFARLGHTLTHLTGGGHSHDVADQVDDALEADAAGRRALWISLAGLAVTAVLQAIVVAWSGSVALLGDTLHNVADALTAVPLLVAFALARRPSSARYPNGYGRAEDLAGLFVVAMITLSAVLAGWQAIDRLLHPQQVTALAAVAGAGVVGCLGNEWVARYRITVGRRIGSAALIADGLHARTDGLTSLAVVLGAGGTALGWAWADPVVGLLIALAILGVLRTAATQVGRRLMDGVDPELTERARAAVQGVLGVRDIDQIRLRWIGHTLRAELTLALDPASSLADVETIAAEARAALGAALPRLTGTTIEVTRAR